MSEAVVALAHCIAEQIGDWEDPAVERAVFGTIDPAEIAALADAFCAAHLGARVSRPLFYRSSIGAVFGVELADGRSVVVKVHQDDAPPAYLAAVHVVQHHLAAHSFPCPVPVLDPTPFARGTGTAEAYLAEGDYQNAHEPWVRRVLAQALVRQVELARGFAQLPGLIDHAPPGLVHYSRTLPPDRLWPKPHSTIFDFDATAAGAEWIDDIGWRARRILAGVEGPNALGHCDWSAKHFRFVDGEVRAIYDWDSLRVDPEPVIVGRAAHAFTAVYDTPWDGKVPHAPSWEEVLAFIADYELARGKPFTTAERRALGAACAYTLAYSSRCSHALDPRHGKAAGLPPGNWRDSLARFGERLLRS